jgi:hypothetical protein
VSITIHLTIDTGGEEPAAVAEMGSIFGAGVGTLSTAGLDLGMLEGGQAGDWVPKLEAVQLELTNNPDKFLAAFPDGGVVAFREVLRWLAQLTDYCKAHPNTTLVVS